MHYVERERSLFSLSPDPLYVFVTFHLHDDDQPYLQL